MPPGLASETQLATTSPVPASRAESTSVTRSSAGVVGSETVAVGPSPLWITSPPGSGTVRTGSLPDSRAVIGELYAWASSAGPERTSTGADHVVPPSVDVIPHSVEFPSNGDTAP